MLMTRFSFRITRSTSKAIKQSDRSQRSKSINNQLQKTECLVVSKKSIIPKYKLQIGNNIIKQVESFKYLGSTITADGKCNVVLQRNVKIVMDKESYE